eukprot:TRINITY_DN5650_c0_g1_i2.p1 TRINITY_DN5650_c0_g1~~TRINITY_DN5650_c0_g1_i2.p1  ORF type:complete len:164 (-),score=17.53 TRINITY_DN5650_c0_g1_i2:201-623(-)
MTPERQELFKQAVEVLREVTAVFDFNAYYVCLFYQKNAVSRFVAQRLLFNVWPLEEHVKRNRVEDLRRDPSMFAYCYFYGLCIHKLAHFHEVVHGTRHDFRMLALSLSLSLFLSFSSLSAPIAYVSSRPTLVYPYTPMQL